ncbi:MAG: Type 1 glutamine amidotransferase-like domain-containing protein [Acidobacteriota bacterium]|nr:Type 1 glutamine amidotransferase-like domain-containing protein [Acidobacteriota bacterium]
MPVYLCRYSSHQRFPGDGWLALLGGGEFSFGETEAADRAWLERAGEGPVGFLPAASGSTEYGEYFADYLDEVFDRELEIIPVYRTRDARRRRNRSRVLDSAAVYLGGGVADQLLEAVAQSAVEEALQEVVARGGVVAANAAAAQACGEWARGLRGEPLKGLGWLPGGVLDTNFDPGHDRRLRQLMTQPGVRWGVGLPAGSALLLGPDGAVEIVGSILTLSDADSDFELLGEGVAPPPLAS